MFKKILIIIVVTVVGLLVFSYFNFNESIPATAQSPAKNENTLSINDVQINIEIADDPSEQAQGLSGREYLAQDSGMLFVFPQPTTPAFWMKDMKFSLDFIWIDEGGEIIEITKSVSPATYPKTFMPPSPVKYVLEVNSGWTEKNGVKVGDKIEF